MRYLVFEGDSWSKYEILRKTNKNSHKKLCGIIREILRSEDPAQGIGKPEPLKYELSGYFSRRLSHFARVVYYFSKTTVAIVAIGGHYSDK